MTADADRARAHIADITKYALKACCALCATLLLGLWPYAAEAQDQPIFLQGDAVVTGYSGIRRLKPAPGQKQEDLIVINRQGASLQVFDLSQMFGADDARLVNAQRFHSVTAGQIGQVFGVALDDGRNGRGPNPVPNIYATATSAFGLQIVETANGERNRAKVGGPNRTWMSGQFGKGLGGGPGSVWKIDGRKGTVSLFANIALNNLPNSGPALGNIAFNPKSRTLYVSDLQTGMIHALDLKGNQLAMFDHGATARPKAGLPATSYDPANRVEITNPAFDSLKPETWGFAPPARKVWGLAVSGGRLYYSVAEGPEIWSVGIRQNGRFANDPRVEIQVQAPSADPISDIAFGRDGTIYLAQRGESASSYDYTVLAKPETAAVLRYTKRKLPSGKIVWQPAPDEYAIGFESQYRNANGGVALGYGYDEFGYISRNACESTLWSTGELLRQSASQEAQLKPGGPMIVHGLQGNALSLVRPSNEGPFKSYFIDYDANHYDPASRGHMGDIAVWSPCSVGAVAKAPPPKAPVGPRLNIAKACSAAPLGGQMHCRVTLTSTGSQAPQGRVGFSDLAEVLVGPSNANVNPLFISAKPDDPGWTCAALPSRAPQCSIDGARLPPGRSHSVDFVLDISEVLDGFDWRVRNCATLDGSKQTSCVSRGDADALIVSKSGPDQATCQAGGFCDFDVTVINPGKRTFDGMLSFGDNLTIGGGTSAGVVVDGVSPSHGCAIPGTSLPLQWQCHTTIPPGDFRTFKVLLSMPATIPAGVTSGRNCFVATDPKLTSFGTAPAPPASTGFFTGILSALTGGPSAPPPSPFWTQMLNPANNGFAPGKDCIDFDIAPAAATGPMVRKPGLPFGPKIGLTSTPRPSNFSKAGEKITYVYRVQNSGPDPMPLFGLRNSKNTAITCPGLPVPKTCPASAKSKGACGSLAAGASAICIATYTTQASDVGKDISTTSNAGVPDQTKASGVGAKANAKALVKFVAPKPSTPVTPPSVSAGKPVLDLAVTTSQPTFSVAGEKITYTYSILNSGKGPATSFALTDSRASGITCKPANTGPLAAGATATCTGSYTTQPGDVGKDITGTASLTGMTATGAIPSAPPANTVVKFDKPKVVAQPAKPSLSLKVVPSQPTFSSVGETITYTYTVKNTGSVPLPLFLAPSSLATNMKCAPLTSPKICPTIMSGAKGICGALAAGASVICTSSHTTTSVDLNKDFVLKEKAAGYLRVPAGAATVPTAANKAALMTAISKPDVEATATALVKFVRPKVAAPPPPQPKLSLNHACDPMKFTGSGQSITCNFMVTNTGAVPVSSCQITGHMNVSCPGPIAPGASVLVKGEYTSTQADIGKDITINYKLVGTP